MRSSKEGAQQEDLTKGELGDKDLRFKKKGKAFLSVRAYTYAQEMLCECIYIYSAGCDKAVEER